MSHQEDPFASRVKFKLLNLHLAHYLLSLVCAQPTALVLKVSLLLHSLVTPLVFFSLPEISFLIYLIFI